MLSRGRGERRTPEQVVGSAVASVRLTRRGGLEGPDYRSSPLLSLVISPEMRAADNARDGEATLALVVAEAIVTLTTEVLIMNAARCLMGSAFFVATTLSASSRANPMQFQAHLWTLARKKVDREDRGSLECECVGVGGFCVVGRLFRW